MANSHGRFVWYELMTSDVDAAKVFYADVVGWGTKDVSMPGMGYTIFTAGSASACGLLDLRGRRQENGREAELDRVCWRQRRGRHCRPD